MRLVFRGTRGNIALRSAEHAQAIVRDHQAAASLLAGLSQEYQVETALAYDRLRLEV